MTFWTYDNTNNISFIRGLNKSDLTLTYGNTNNIAFIRGLNKSDLTLIYDNTNNIAFIRGLNKSDLTLIYMVTLYTCMYADHSTYTFMEKYCISIIPHPVIR